MGLQNGWASVLGTVVLSVLAGDPISRSKILT